MPFDGARADEQFGADLRVRSARDGESRDVLLLRCEVIASVVSALADGLTGREQFVSRALGEAVRTDRGERVMRGAQLLARIDSAAFAPQPFPVEQLPAGEFHAQAGTSEQRDRVAVIAFGFCLVQK